MKLIKSYKYGNLQSSNVVTKKKQKEHAQGIKIYKVSDI
jgi:hypothetical protein